MVEVFTGIISSVLSVEVAIIGVVVEVVGIEVVVAGVVVAVVGDKIVVVDVVVVAVGAMVGGVEVACSELVEVAVGSRTVSRGVSGIVVDPRCLLSHSATAVTPSCHDA